MQRQLKQLELFLKSSYFERGFRLGVAVAVPFTLLYLLGYAAYAPAIMMGTFLNAPGDIPGSSQRKVNAILVSITVILIITTVILFVKPLLPLLLVVLAFTSFSISMISVYGFRASLVSFSGLLAMVLALVIHKETTIEILTQIGLMAIGGVWYLVIAFIFRRFSPKKEQNQLLSDSLQLTGQYLKLRAKILTKKEQRDDLLQQTFELQHQINEKHETLRETLLTGRKKSGHSRYEEKQLLIFLAAVNIFELIEAKHLDYKTIDREFHDKKEFLKASKKGNLTMGNHLICLSELLINKGKIPKKEKLLKALSKANQSITDLIKIVKLPEARESALILRNLYDYQEQLLQEITSIRRAMSTTKNKAKRSLKKKDSSHFLTTQDYSFKVLLQNFSLSSTIFRHSLRFSIAIVFAYLLGVFFDIQNTHWILLTIVVIMRPNYGLTKERSKNRIIGTLIGAALAMGIIFMTQNITAYLIIAICSLVLAFSLIQQNYKYAALFITISVLMVNSSLYPDAIVVIQYRVVDTLIGTIIAIVANYSLFPSWESNNLKEVLQKALEKNIEYLTATQTMYQDKSKQKFKYNLARKEAFLAMSNLNAAFQRVSQDPKSKQKEFQLIYEIVTINHTMISAIASIGNFILNHKTTPVSQEFNTLVKKVSETLQTTIDSLKDNQATTIDSDTIVADEELMRRYQQLSNLRDENIKKGKTTLNTKTLHGLQEAYLISNQMSWLISLSEKLNKVTGKYSSSLISL